MSQMIPGNQIENGDIFGMLIDDTSVFNLQILQGGLGLTSVQSTKEWCYKHGIRPVINGRTWLFTGKLFRQDLEGKRQSEAIPGSQAIGNEAG